MELSAATRSLYRGALRVLLVLLHDFPEFLCDYHFGLCEVIPPACIQMRNLVLSAFPRNMRLPDPFTPNLKVDHLPEISQPPRMLAAITPPLVAANLLTDLESFLATRQPFSLPLELRSRVTADGLQSEAELEMTRHQMERLISQADDMLSRRLLYVDRRGIEPRSPAEPQRVPQSPLSGPRLRFSDW